MEHIIRTFRQNWYFEMNHHHDKTSILQRLNQDSNTILVLHNGLLVTRVSFLEALLAAKGP